MRRIFRICPAALAGCLLSFPLAAAEWEVDKEESHLAFHGSMLGVSAVGFFRHFESEIAFGPDDVENAHVVIDVDMASVDSAHDERDTALKLPEWFAAGAFPRAHFEARNFQQLDDTSFEAQGSLTIKGITQEITLPFTLSIDGGNAFATGSLDLNRSDFEIGTGEWATNRLVAFDVHVEFHIVARAPTAP